MTTLNEIKSVAYVDRVYAALNALRERTYAREGTLDLRML